MSYLDKTGLTHFFEKLKSVFAAKNHTHTKADIGLVNVDNVKQLPIAGGTMTGTLTLKGSQFNDAYGGALNANNSNIYGVNSIYTADASEDASEGIHFYRDASHVDTLWMNGGDLLFTPNRALAGSSASTSKANSEKVARLPASITADRVVLTDGTTGKLKTGRSQNAFFLVGDTQVHRTAGNVSPEPQHASFANPKNTIEYEFIKPIAGIGDWFYAAHLNSDYTITSNYSGKNGTKGYFYISTLFSPSGASTCLLDVDELVEKPFVLEITKNSGVITATDVVHLELWGHTITGTSAKLDTYKVELLTTGTTSSSGEFTWQTVYERENAEDKINGLTIPLNPTTLPYIYFKGVRLTISKAIPGSTTPSNWNYNCIDLTLFRLIDQRPAFSAARALGALDLSGGTVYGAVELRNTLSVAGKITGTVTNAEKVNNHTVNADVPSGAKFTDTNTWRGVQDNLTSDSATDSLSAKQGKALANGSARDSTKLPLAGGTMTGALNFANGTLNTVGDDAYLGDQNVAGMVAVKGKNGTTGIRMIAKDATNNAGASITWDGTNLSLNGYTVKKSVPSDAKFTDTTYTAATAAPGKVASASSQGTSTNYARQDHTHGIDVATGDANGQVKIAGQNASVKGLAALAYKASLGKSDVGLGNVDNTSDANKPVSTAQQKALNNRIGGLLLKQTQASSGYKLALWDGSTKLNEIGLSEATQTFGGLMSSTDKSRLDSLVIDGSVATASMVQISLAEGAWTQETDDYWQSELGLYKKKFAVPSGFSSGSFWIIPLSYGLRDQLLNGHWIVDNGYIWFYGDSNSNTSDISFNALLIKSAGVHGGFNTLNFPGQFGLDLLWENANPTATFGAQTISLNALSKYDGVLVESNTYAQSNANHYLCTDIAFKGRTGAIRLNGTSNAGFRNFTVGEDSIVFKNAYWGGSSASNGSGIPIRIFGFRVNSFR